jgi:hypothetical protein
MKYIRSILTGSLLLMLSFYSNNLQSISDSSKYFFVGYNTSQPGNYSYINTLTVTFSMNDTIAFKLSGGGNSDFIKYGNYIYKISDNDSLLLYDYTLQEGDTFKCDPKFGHNDTIFI